MSGREEEEKELFSSPPSSSSSSFSYPSPFLFSSRTFSSSSSSSSSRGRVLSRIRTGRIEGRYVAKKKGRGRREKQGFEEERDADGFDRTRFIRFD